MRDWLGIFGCALRATLATLLLFVCMQDGPAAQAHAGFAVLPDFDFRAEAESLIGQERYSEALLVIEAAMAEATPQEFLALDELRQRAETERDEVLRRARAAARGAWSGRGNSTEELGGALVADLFVFGDVRDLVIQSGNYVRGRDVDEVLVALSAAGIALTATPSLDFGTALLKFARRVGALSEAFAKSLIRMGRRAAQRRNAQEVKAVASDAAKLGESARPAVTFAILKNVDDAEELRLAARFAQKPGGAYSLWLGGKPALSWIKQAGPEGEAFLLRAARKGRAGMEFLAQNGSLLLRAHPFLGLFKAFHKGNAQALLGEWLRRYSGALLGFVAAWLAFELALFSVRLRHRWSLA